MAQTFAQSFASARRVSAPIVLVRTPDNIATQKLAVETALTVKSDKLPPSPLMLSWDFARGLTAILKEQQPKLDALLTKATLPVAKTVNATETLMALLRCAPVGTIAFFHNPHLVWSNPGMVQALANLRDEFKSTLRMIACLVPLGTEPPNEVKHDTIVIEDPLPDALRLSEVVRKTITDNGLPAGDDDLARATKGVRGLSAFVAETAVAMALRAKGINFEALRDQRVTALQSAAGITVHRGTETFADVIGLDGIKADLARLKTAKNKVNVVVVLDEFEKVLSGSQAEHGDNTGTAQRQAGHILRWMQDQDVRGIIEFGHPGVGKTHLAKALANELGCDCLLAEMDKTLDSKLGASESRLRTLTDTVDAIAGKGGAFVIATCNGMAAFTTEMRRRFTRGIYFVELPTDEVKAAAWQYWCAKYGVAVKQPRPDDTGWTVSEIKVCCEQAFDYDIPLVQASRNIVPVAKAQPDVIGERRRYAHGKLLDAATGSVYTMPGQELDQPVAATTGRTVTNLPD